MIPPGIDCDGLNKADLNEITRIGFWAWLKKAQAEQRVRLSVAKQERAKKFSLTPSRKRA